MRSWAFDKQLGWAYALNEIFGKDKEVLEKTATQVKSASNAPVRKEVTKTINSQSAPLKSGIQKSTGKRFVKSSNGQLKTEII